MNFEILDVGSGTYPKGDVNIDSLITSTERKQFVTSTDTSGGTFIKADAHFLPIKHESFPIVVCRHTLEHLLKPSNVLLEIYKVLKVNGTLILELPNAKVVLKEHPTHLYSWTPDSITNLLEVINFKIIDRHEDGINFRIIARKI